MSRSSRTGGGIALGALGALERVANHRLLDRLIRGRATIGIVAFALIGIVTLQLGLLKLNTSIGRTLERESQLQRQNATLSVENSELTEANRVESSAAQLGMEPVPARALRFLSARAGVDAARGAAAIKTSIQASGGEAGSTHAARGEPPEAGASPTSTSESNGESAPKPSGLASSSGSGEATAQGAPASTQPASGTSPAASVPGGSSSEAAPSGGGTTGSAGTADGAGGQAAPTG